MVKVLQSFTKFYKVLRPCKALLVESLLFGQKFYKVLQSFTTFTQFYETQTSRE